MVYAGRENYLTDRESVSVGFRSRRAAFRHEDVLDRQTDKTLRGKLSIEVLLGRERALKQVTFAAELNVVGPKRPGLNVEHPSTRLQRAYRERAVRLRRFTGYPPNFEAFPRVARKLQREQV